MYDEKKEEIRSVLFLTEVSKKRSASAVNKSMGLARGERNVYI